MLEPEELEPEFPLETLLEPPELELLEGLEVLEALD